MNLTAFSLQTLIALSGISLLLSATLLRTVLFFKLSKQAAYLISVLFFAASFVVISGDSINLYFRGLVNDLSITTLVMLSYYYIQPEQNKEQTRPLFLSIAIIGLFFYPTVLGLGSVDPYSWGFMSKDQGLLPPLIFLILLAGLMCFALFMDFSLLLFCLVLAVLAYLSGVLESRNLWDYLFDPLIFIYALVTIISQLLSNNK